MATTRAATTGAPPTARPGRAALVADSLDHLSGPADGIVELPLRMFWSAPDRTFDLADSDMLCWMYQIVLREAITPGELSTYLNKAILLRLWPGLVLPRAVRQAWEARHPALRAAASAAA